MGLFIMSEKENVIDYRYAAIVKIQYPCNMILSFVLFYHVKSSIFKIHIQIAFQLINTLKIPMQCPTIDTCVRHLTH